MTCMVDPRCQAVNFEITTLMSYIECTLKAEPVSSYSVTVNPDMAYAIKASFSTDDVTYTTEAATSDVTSLWNQFTTSASTQTTNIKTSLLPSTSSTTVQFTTSTTVQTTDAQTTNVMTSSLPSTSSSTVS